LLKEPRRLDDLNGDEPRQAELVPRLLAIALAGFALFGVALVLILHFTPPQAYPHSPLPVPRAGLRDGSGLALVLAYTLGLVAATGLCLPSFYFFSLLAGGKMRLSQIVSQVLCSTATTAVVLGCI